MKQRALKRVREGMVINEETLMVAEMRRESVREWGREWAGIEETRVEGLSERVPELAMRV